MKVGAIISEFNPFHKGHKHLIDCAKNSVCAHVVSIMSGNYVQRGEPAVFSKKYRVESALKNGVDLVVEMPSIWAVSRAERYAEAGVWLADALGCVDFLLFGSECGNLDPLVRVSDLLKTSEFHESLTKHLNQGFAFAKARENAVIDLIGSDNMHEIMSSPNNVLGIEYVKSINKFKSSIIPVTFQRDKNVKSASQIREFLKHDDDLYRQYIPSNLSNCAEGLKDIFWGERAVVAVLKTLSLDYIRGLPDISEGLENKIYNAVHNNSDLDSIFKSIKSKRYTMSRIKRIILCAYLGITGKSQEQLPPYLRILGATEKGLEILKNISETAKLPIVSTYSELKRLDGFSNEVFETECRATDLSCVFNKQLVPVQSEKEFKFIRQEPV